MSYYKSSKTIDQETQRLRLMSSLGTPLVLKSLEIAKEIIEKENIVKTKTGHLVKSKADPSILDAGCGTGEDFLIFRKVFPHAKITGIDNSNKALQKAKEKNMAQNLLRANILSKEDMDKVGKNKFDIVFVKTVLMHANLASRLLRMLAFLGFPGLSGYIKKQGERGALNALINLKQTLKAGGAIIAIEPDYQNMNCPFKGFFAFKKSLIEAMQGYGIDPFIGQKLERYFRKAGFSHRRIFDFGMKISPKDEGWEIIDMLYDVAEKLLVKRLKKHGVDDFKKIIRRASHDNSNIFTPPLGLVVIARKTAK
jgi:SAM-dependent methyltransferase